MTSGDMTCEEAWAIQERYAALKNPPTLKEHLLREETARDVERLLAESD